MGTDHKQSKIGITHWTKIQGHKNGWTTRHHFHINLSISSLQLEEKLHPIAQLKMG